MQRSTIFFALLSATTLLATGAIADTETTDATQVEETAAVEAEADGETVAVADADAQESTATDGATGEDSGSGDADAGGPVAETPTAPAEDDTSTEADKKKKAEGGTVAEELTPESTKKKDGAERGSDTPAAMAPGGVVGGSSSFPLGVTVSSTTSVASGTFAPGYTNNPSVFTTVGLRPRLNVPKLVDWQPTALVVGSLTASMEWASSQTGTPFAGPRDRQVRISDGAVSVVLPGLVVDPWLGVSLTPIMTGRIPLSVASRWSQRLFGVGGALMVGYNFSSFVGTISAQYVGAGSYWEHANTNRKLPCGQQMPTGGTFLPGTGVSDGQTELPMAVGRIEEVSEDGQCIQVGRQIIGSVTNSGTLAYTAPQLLGTHTVSVNGAAIHSIWRPLSYAPDLRSQFAQPQSVINAFPWSSMTVAYNWGVPGDWVPFGGNLQFATGVTSTQPMFDGRGFVRPPMDLFFWAPRSTGDSPVGLNVQSGYNAAQGFATLTLGI